MKNILCLALLLSVMTCSYAQSDENITIQKIVLDSSDANYGYYLSVKPKGKIETVLVLFPGSHQRPEDVFLDTEFHKYAIEQNILTISFAGRTKLTADSSLRQKINLVLTDVIQKTKIEKDKFVLGGFSAGGVIALRYTELCHQFPDEYPVQPQGVFMADAPIDLFHLWNMQQENRKNNYSAVSVQEANWIDQYFVESYGATPSEHPETYIDLSPFSINQAYGNNEQYLKNVAVRSYHDIDIAWRLHNRNQTARFDNFVAAAELINRLLVMGNTRAEFMQSFKTGYRRDGRRHPHSWSIVEEKECVDWIKGIME